MVRGETEQVLGMSSLAFGLLFIAGGFAAYGLKLLFQSNQSLSVVAQKPENPA